MFPKDKLFCFLVGNRSNTRCVVQELLLAEKWARENKIKFPPINAEEQYKKHGMKEFYVFEDPEDLDCPVIVHFVLCNKTFKEQSSPGLFKVLLT